MEFGGGVVGYLWRLLRAGFSSLGGEIPRSVTTSPFIVLFRTLRFIPVHCIPGTVWDVPLLNRWVLRSVT